MITEPLTLSRLRSRYQDDSTQLRQSFERNGDGSAVIRRRSQIVGTLLLQLGEHVAPIAPQNDIALVATGGFGRRELFPCSDVDVLFLCANEKVEPAWSDRISACRQALWDV